MSIHECNKIKLIANNEKDLNVISAYIQDSIVVIKDIVFLKKNKIFIILFNRFIWENLKRNNKNERIRCALKFEGVLDAKSKKINQKHKNKILEFLAIESNMTSDSNYEINFFFSGGGIITLISESIEVLMQDLGKAWDVRHVPRHKI